jgi:hypothetical protein
MTVLTAGTLYASPAQATEGVAGSANTLATPTGIGYRLAGADGGVFAFGGVGFFGSMVGRPLNQPVVGIASPDTGGYWLVSADGGVFAFGDAQYLSSMDGHALNQPIVGIVNKFVPAGGGVPASGNGAAQGYWEVARDGGVFAFGNAAFYGSLAGLPLSAPIVGMATTFDGAGYWLIGQDGAIYAFGDAAFPNGYRGPPLTAISGTATSELMVGMTHFGMDNSSILTVSNFGRVFPYPNGSAMPVVQVSPAGGPGAYVVGISATISPIGDAYAVTSNGGVTSYNGAPLFGSMAGQPLNQPVVGIDGY